MHSLKTAGGLTTILSATIQAGDDWVLVGSLALPSSQRVLVNFDLKTAQGSFTALFTGRFTSIDEVRFVDQGTNFSFDDISIARRDDDKIEAAPGTDIAALVASAISDGQGGTLLTHPNGSIRLVGVDPASYASGGDRGSDS